MEPVQPRSFLMPSQVMRSGNPEALNRSLLRRKQSLQEEKERNAARQFLLEEQRKRDELGLDRETLELNRQKAQEEAEFKRQKAAAEQANETIKRLSGVLAGVKPDNVESLNSALLSVATTLGTDVAIQIKERIGKDSLSEEEISAYQRQLRVMMDDISSATLSPGQKRIGPFGRTIAEVAPTPKDIKTWVMPGGRVLNLPENVAPPAGAEPWTKPEENLQTFEEKERIKAKYREQGKGKADDLESLESLYKWYIGQYTSAARGVDQYIGNPIREDIAKDMLNRANAIAKQYEDAGGNPKNLGIEEDQTKKAEQTTAYESPEDVRAAYQEGTLTKEEAKKILMEQF